MLNQLRDRNVVESIPSSSDESSPLSSAAPDRPSYNSAAYWDERYKSGKDTDDNFEWIVTYKDLKLVVDEFLEGAAKVLHPGCGGSTLGLEVRRTFGSRLKIVNVDVSDSCIARMRELYPEGRWEVVDSCSPPEGEHRGGYDRVLDKCLLDAFCCGGTEREKRDLVGSYLDHCWGCLGVGGRMMVISFGQPETRERYFEGKTYGKREGGWSWERVGGTRTMEVKGEGGKNAMCYVYELRKLEEGKE